MKDVLALLTSDQACIAMSLAVCVLYWILLWRVSGRWAASLLK